MNARKLLVVAATAALLAATGLAVARSTWDTGPAAADRVAAGLRCPSCEGETVADSRSPVAAAMREVIAEQVAAGRTPDQVRDWFVQRYGAEVLADPPSRGIGVLLWVLPGAVLLLAVALAVRTMRHPNEMPSSRPALAHRPERAPGGTKRAHAWRTWDMVAIGVIGMVAAVALMAARVGNTNPPSSTGPTSAPADPVAQQLNIAQSLEAQGQYAAAAGVYRAVAEARPDPQVRLRLAVTLIRAGQPTEAAAIAREVLAGRPTDADAVLVLGLAERATRSPAADETLRRFLRLAPDHPAAAEIRRLLPPGG